MRQQVMTLLVAALLQFSHTPIAFGRDDDGAVGDRMIDFEAMSYEGAMPLAIIQLRAASGRMFGTNVAFRAVETVDLRSTIELKEMSIHVKAPYARLGNWERYELSLANISSQVDPGGDKLAKQLGVDEAIHIVIPESNTWYIVYPKLRAYVVVDQLPGLAVGEELPPRIDKKAMGEERIGELLCMKYHASVNSFSGDFNTIRWEAKMLDGLPVRDLIEEQGVHLETQLSNVKIAKPPRTDFEPPRNYKRYSGKEFMELIESKIRQIPLKKAPTPSASTQNKQVEPAQNETNQSASKISSEDKLWLASHKSVEELTDQALLSKLALEDKDWLIREAAVKNSNLTNQSVIASLAVKDENVAVRFAAVDKLTDQSLLDKIAVEDKSWEVRSAAVRHLTNQTVLEKVAVEEENKYIRRSATEKMTNQTVLARIAIGDKWEEVRMAAVKNLNDQAVLEEVAIADNHETVRWLAIDKITNQTVLAKIAIQEKTEWVRRDAVKKLTDQILLAKIAAEDEGLQVRWAAFRKLKDKVILEKFKAEHPTSPTQRSGH